MGGNLAPFSKLNSTWSFPKSKDSVPFLTSIRHPAVARNGFLRMMVRVSSYISRITKPIGTYKSPTFIGTSSKIATGYFIQRSANCKEIVVGLISPSSIFSHIERGIKFTLDCKSHQGQSIGTFPIRQGIEKLPGSFSLARSLFGLPHEIFQPKLQFSVIQVFSCWTKFLSKI